MKKLWLIIKREYFTRVRKRSFILGTLLTPVAFAVFFLVIGLIFSYDGSEKLRVAIVDPTNILQGNKPANETNLTYVMEQGDFEQLSEDIEDSDYDVAVKVPPITNLNSNDYTFYYESKSQLGLEVQSRISDRLADKVRDYKMFKFELDKKELESLRTSVNLRKADDEKESTFTTQVGAAIGGIMGFIMYMSVFIYGMMVMRSVMEEKTSRIVEVMISSVRPFQLMMGKIIGVGFVGLTQIAIWAILIPVFYLLFGFFFDIEAQQQVATAGGTTIDADEARGMIAQAWAAIGELNWWLIVPLFIFYFVGGFFLYSSLFAAVGSAMGDDYGEGQSLMFPITIPVLLALYIMMATVRMPQSDLAVWSSMFPLFSPIVMPARLAFDPPMWQVAVSMILLIGTVFFFVWFSARIYRVGIFMYGKKVTLREIGRWLFYKH